MHNLSAGFLLLSLTLVSLLPLIASCAENLALQQSAGSLVLTAEEQQYLKNKQQISMCVNPDSMPYGKIEQGKYVGMGADLMRLLEKKINTPVVLVSSKSWLESLEMAKQRQCDILALAMSTPERKRFLNFTSAYLSFPLAIAVSYQQDFISGIEEVLDKQLGIQKGYAYAELLRLLYPAIDLVEVDSLNEGLDQVSRNQLFGMIDSLAGISYAFQKKYIGELKIAGKLEQQFSMGVGARNDEPLLVDIFNKAIAQLSKQEQRDIINHWIAIKYESRENYILLLGYVTVKCGIL